MNKIGNDDIIPTIPEDISDELKKFLLLCLKRNPNERASINELKDYFMV